LFVRIAAITQTMHIASKLRHDAMPPTSTISDLHEICDRADGFFDRNGRIEGGK
jgi:hypothetical protein